MLGASIRPSQQDLLIKTHVCRECGNATRLLPSHSGCLLDTINIASIQSTIRLRGIFSRKKLSPFRRPDFIVSCQRATVSPTTGTDGYPTKNCYRGHNINYPLPVIYPSLICYLPDYRLKIYFWLQLSLASSVFSVQYKNIGRYIGTYFYIKNFNKHPK